MDFAFLVGLEKNVKKSSKIVLKFYNFINFFPKFRFFRQSFAFRSKLRFLMKISIFGQNFRIDPSFDY